MKKIIVISIAIVLIAAGYKALKEEAKRNLSLNAKIAGITDKINEARALSIETLKGLKEKGTIITPPSGEKDSEEVKGIRIYLKHGGIIDGKLLEQTGDEYTVEWKGEKFVLNANQIEKVEHKTGREVEWAYKNDVVVKKTNGIILDGEIIAVSPDEVTISFSEGGGGLEMGVKKSEIDHLIFAPVCNKESDDIEKRLKKLFPKMKMYKEGNVTLVTDSYVTWVKVYKKTVNAVNIEIYLKFFKLFKGRKANTQNFVVIFDDPNDFAEYCATDGVPFWLVLGYFMPTDKVLYLYNAFGEKWEKYVFEIALKIIGEYDAWIESMKEKYKIDKRYDIFIDGLTKESKDRFWNAYNFYKSELSGITISTLRHEFTHELFHNWGLQSIVLSKPNIDQKELTDKKKEFLETEDLKKKEELFKILMKIEETGEKDIKMEAAESWMNEGLATYFETDPPGGTDEPWLFLYQEMARSNEVNPIEFLTNFKMGSFPGLCNKATGNAYAQSWALATFLINKYPEEFTDYQENVAQDTSGKEQDNLDVLLGCLKKDLPTLEKEFKEYMDTYEKAEDPLVKTFMKYEEIYRRY